MTVSSVCDVCEVEVADVSEPRDGVYGWIFTRGDGSYCSLECLSQREPRHRFLHHTTEQS